MEPHNVREIAGIRVKLAANVDQPLGVIACECLTGKRPYDSGSICCQNSDFLKPLLQKVGLFENMVSMGRITD
jgi:hypothetical protein